MSFIRLYHAKILTMEEDAEVFDGEVHIDGNRISYGKTIRSLIKENLHGKLTAKEIF